MQSLDVAINYTCIIQCSGPGRVKLFDALVRRIMSYACEVWAIVGGKGALQDLERVKLRFLKLLLGVPQNTSNKLVYVSAEFGRLPLKHFGFSNASNVYSECCHLTILINERLCKAACMEDNQKQIGWFHGLREQLRPSDVRMPRALEDINCKALA